MPRRQKSFTRPFSGDGRRKGTVHVESLSAFTNASKTDVGANNVNSLHLDWPCSRVSSELVRRSLLVFFYYWLVWILPLIQHPIWGQKVGPLTVFEYIGVACFVYACSHIVARGMFPPILSSWETRLVFLLYTVALFSALIKGRGIGLDN